ncbi:hypothetical protein ES703_48126 [subsurface metagenome]
MRKGVKKCKGNRLVLGACTHISGQMLDELTAGVGLDPALVRVVNLREEVVWVHRDQLEKALAKAKSMLAMAIEDIRQQDCLPTSPMTVTPNALVIGGGVAGMTAALSIARHEIEVYLVEKSSELAGIAVRRRHLRVHMPVNTGVFLHLLYGVPEQRPGVAAFQGRVYVFQVAAKFR